MGFDPKKYIVHKVDKEGKKAQILSPEEYFVIKRGDILGAASLWSYVHNLRTLIEIGAMFGNITPDQQTHLTDLADGVSEIASKWEFSNQKIPD